ALRREMEPLVMASEITGLANLRGYLKMGNLVVRLSVPFLDLPMKAPRLLERTLPPPDPSTPVASVPDAGAPALTIADPGRSRTPRRRRSGPGQDLIF